VIQERKKEIDQEIATRQVNTELEDTDEYNFKSSMFA
jgi:hypothetical protein